MELASIGTQLQLQPNTTRHEFKVAYDRLIGRNTRKPLMQAIGYAPMVLDADRALFESAAQIDLNDPTFVINDGRQSFAPEPKVSAYDRYPIQPEYFPISYTEPLTAKTRVRLGELTNAVEIVYLIACSGFDIFVFCLSCTV
jgi:hypothetical protein